MGSREDGGKPWMDRMTEALRGVACTLRESMGWNERQFAELLGTGGRQARPMA